MGESRRAVIPFARRKVDNRTACIFLALELNIKTIEPKRLPAAYGKEQMVVSTHVLPAASAEIVCPNACRSANRNLGSSSPTEFLQRSSHRPKLHFYGSLVVDSTFTPLPIGAPHS
jgi:hypothetical protein